MQLKLTKPQAHAAILVAEGWRMKTINKHWKSGGTQIWVRGEETMSAQGDKSLIGFLRKKYGYFFTKNSEYKGENYFSK